MDTRHPFVQAWLDGNLDGGGCIGQLERENASLRRFVKDWLDDWIAPGPTDSPRETEARQLLAPQPLPFRIVLPGEPGYDATADLRAKYDELIFAVGKVYPGESRHQTALRYIVQAEIPSREPPNCAR